MRSTVAERLAKRGTWGEQSMTSTEAVRVANRSTQWRQSMTSTEAVRRANRSTQKRQSMRSTVRSSENCQTQRTGGTVNDVNWSSDACKP